MKTWAFRIVGILLPVALVGAALGTSAVLLATAPRPERTESERIAPLVEVLPLGVEDMPRIVEVHGDVVPEQHVTIVPEVQGRVVELHPALEPGGLVAAGDVLIRIDPEAYRLAVSQAQAALEEAEAALAVEQGRQKVAEREWELFGRDLPDAELSRSLALREPQLRQAQARIASARSAVEQAKLDLKRTDVLAPFDAIILRESVDLGQRVSPGDSIAVLAGTDAFWVRAKAIAARLPALIEAAQQGAETARVYPAAGAVELDPIPATVIRYLPEVDPAGKMAQILLRVEDPLGLKPENAGRTPLPLNSFIRAELDAGMVRGAVPVPRFALRENRQVWVADADNRLQVRPAETVWAQGQDVMVRDVFEPGDRLIVSPLEEVLPGSEVRTEEVARETVASPELPIVGGLDS